MNNAAERQPIGPMTDSEFADFQRITVEMTGIRLSDKKRAMLTNRLAKRLIALGIDTYQDYLYLLKNENSAEKTNFINSVTTNLTYFYREPHHFEFFSNTVLPTVAANSKPNSPIRIWSAGCSYGQEPYTLAMAISESDVIAPVRVLCTDIDSATVQSVQKGCYKKEYLRGLSNEQIRKWFVQRTDGTWQAIPELRSLLICKQLNLFNDWPIRPGVDVIMCRNVLIYFNAVDQLKLVRRFAQFQEKGAFLFLGHSENIKGIDSNYRRVDNTVYERI